MEEENKENLVSTETVIAKKTKEKYKGKVFISSDQMIFVRFTDFESFREGVRKKANIDLNEEHYRICVGSVRPKDCTGDVEPEEWEFMMEDMAEIQEGYEQGKYINFCLRRNKNTETVHSVSSEQNVGKEKLENMENEINQLKQIIQQTSVKARQQQYEQHEQNFVEMKSNSSTRTRKVDVMINYSRKREEEDVFDVSCSSSSQYHDNEVVEEEDVILEEEEGEISDQRVCVGVSSTTYYTENETKTIRIQFCEETSCTTTKDYKIVLFGKSAVGKSSLLLRFKDDKFHPNISATIGFDFVTKHFQCFGENVVFGANIYDTAGQERFQAFTGSYPRGAKGVIYVMSPDCFDILGQLEQTLKYDVDLTSVPFILVANKIDLCYEKEVMNEYDELIHKAREFLVRNGVSVRVFKCSCKESEKLEIDQIFGVLFSSVVGKMDGKEEESTSSDNNPTIKLDFKSSDKDVVPLLEHPIFATHHTATRLHDCTEKVVRSDLELHTKVHLNSSNLKS